MAGKDKRIDAYIEKSAEFARPILIHLRKLVHRVCPDVEETIRWGFPHFDYKKSMMCSMAAFKNHAVMSFWKAALFKNPKKLIDTAKSEVAMGHLGKITSLKDLPADKVIEGYIKEAMKLNEAGVKLSPEIKSSLKKPVKTPGYFLTAIKKNKKAFNTYAGFSNSCKREYVEWITTAKTTQTREKRMVRVIEWISEGKIRNWKYVR